MRAGPEPADRNLGHNRLPPPDTCFSEHILVTVTEEVEPEPAAEQPTAEEPMADQPGGGYLVEAGVRVAIVENTSTGTALVASKFLPYVGAAILAGWTAAYARYQWRKA